MTTLDDLAAAALGGDALALRGFVQDLVRSFPVLAMVPPPASTDRRLLAVAAAIVELLAERSGQSPPIWTADIGPVSDPIHLLTAARTMIRLRRLCEAEAPWPLRRRGLYAPPNYLVWV